MKIVIFGAAGFIGTNLVKCLLDKDTEFIVWGVDNLDTGKIENLQPYMSNSRFEFFLGSNHDEAFVELLVAEADVVIDAVSTEDIPRMIASQVYGTRAILNCLTHSQQFIRVSDASVYGPYGVHPHRESDTPYPQTSRQAAILGADYYAYAARREKKGSPHILILRPVYLFGPGDSPRNLMGDLFINAQHDGCSEEHESMYTVQVQILHVSDFCEVVARLVMMRKPLDGIFNIGSGTQLIVSDIVKTILMELGISHVEAEQYKISRKYGVSSDLLKELIGEYERRDIRDAIRATVAHYRAVDMA